MTHLIHFHQRATAFFVNVVRSVFWPKAELLMRLWLSKIFIVSALVKMADWQTALQLAAHEYPLAWLSPATEAYVGVSVEMIAGTLLALGAFTRVAALALFCLSLTIQVSYLPFDNQLFWIALFAWYVVSGPGLFSVDQLFALGLSESALPGAAGAARLIRFIDGRAKPLVVSLLRVWISLSLLSITTAWGRHLLDANPAFRDWLPTHVALGAGAAVAMLGGALLLVGLGTRYVAVLMGISLLGGAMMHGQLLDTTYLVMVLAILFLDGAGSVSLDVIFSEYFERRFERQLALSLHRDPSAPRVVIVGAGFAGIRCAQGLRNTRAAVTLIDRTNYQLFQPLLYQVATAALSPGDIASPIRASFRDMPGMRCMLCSVTAVNTAERYVAVADRKIPYDFLVLATGATHSYFGNERWATDAPGLKRMGDALEIRRRVLTAFELAENTEDPEAQRALLTFLIVGGGPTGVELAGAIAELAKFGMSRDFRCFDPAKTRVALVQSGAALLPAFPASLSAIALKSLEILGVEVLLGSRVEDITSEGVRVNGIDIAARTVLWAAGVSASPAARWLGADADTAGRIRVGPDLSVPGLVNTFAIGDTALSHAWREKPVPGLAPAAKQGGAYVARVIKAVLESRPLPAAFRYRHLGNLATIGRKAAVADFGFVRLWGAPAWWLWGLIHVGFLVGARNRASTLMNWFWAYLTFGGGARLTALSDTQATIRTGDHLIRSVA